MLSPAVPLWPRTYLGLAKTPPGGTQLLSRAHPCTQRRRDPGNGKRKKEWDAIAVCGEVYRDAIHDIAKEVSGLTAQDQRGWLPEYMKARRAYYYLLGDEQREELETLATKWNRGSIPMHLKKKYAVRCLRVRLFSQSTDSTSVLVNLS